MKIIENLVLRFFCVALLASSCGGDECTPNDRMICTLGVTYWIDSCGNEGDKVADCDCGCNDYMSGCKTPCDCVPECDGKVCGPNGCEGTCSPGCHIGQECNNLTGQCIEMIYGRAYRLIIRHLQIRSTTCEIPGNYWDPDQGSMDYIGAPDPTVCIYEGRSTIPTGNEVSGIYCTSQINDAFDHTYNESFTWFIFEENEWLILVLDHDGFEGAQSVYQVVAAFYFQPFPVAAINDGEIILSGHSTDACISDLVITVEAI